MEKNEKNQPPKEPVFKLFIYLFLHSAFIINCLIKCNQNGNIFVAVACYIPPLLSPKRYFFSVKELEVEIYQI